MVLQRLFSDLSRRPAKNLILSCRAQLLLLLLIFSSAILLSLLPLSLPFSPSTILISYPSSSVSATTLPSFYFYFELSSTWEFDILICEWVELLALFLSFRLWVGLLQIFSISQVSFTLFSIFGLYCPTAGVSVGFVFFYLCSRDSDISNVHSIFFFFSLSVYVIRDEYGRPEEWGRFFWVSFEAWFRAHFENNFMEFGSQLSRSISSQLCFLTIIVFIFVIFGKLNNILM